MCVDSLVLVNTLFPGSPAMEGGTSKWSFLLWESLCGNEARLGAKNESHSNP